MKSKKTVIPKNYLDKIPSRAKSIEWTTDGDGIVTLEIKNTGWANKIAQVLFKRHKISYIHLDKMGSFIWPIMDGKKDITAIGKLVEQRFGKEAHPLYERLAKYFQIMDSYHFIAWVDSKTKSK